MEILRNRGTTVDIISHSLGARVALKALKEPTVTLVRNYYCMAGAVDNECLEPHEEFFDARTSMQKLYVMHSAKDDVLAKAYRIAEFDNALGLFGPEDKSVVTADGSNIYVTNCKQVVTYHGGYKRSQPVFDYIASTHRHAPERFVTL